MNRVSAQSHFREFDQIPEPSSRRVFSLRLVSNDDSVDGKLKHALCVVVKGRCVELQSLSRPCHTNAYGSLGDQFICAAKLGMQCHAVTLQRIVTLMPARPALPALTLPERSLNAVVDRHKLGLVIARPRKRNVQLEAESRVVRI